MLRVHTADIGLGLVIQQNRQAALGLASRGPARVQEAIIGWTTPAVTYDRMRAINADVERLDAAIQAYVPAGPYKSGWNAWKAQWNPFYNKYAGNDPSTWAKVMAGFDSDALAAQVDTYAAQYQSYFDDYQKQKQANGQAVPTIAPPTRPIIQTPTGLPWWFWTGVGVTAVGVGYLVWNRVTDTQRRLRYVDAHAPEIIDAAVPGGHGKQIAEFGQGRSRP